MAAGPIGPAAAVVGGHRLAVVRTAVADRRLVGHIGAVGHSLLCVSLGMLWPIF